MTFVIPSARLVFVASGEFFVLFRLAGVGKDRIICFVSLASTV